MTKDVNNMSFLDHLEDLRWHLIRCIIAIFACGIIAFCFPSFIFDVIILGPQEMSFPTYQWLCNVANTFGFEDSTFCADEFPFDIQNRKMTGQFSIHIWTSIYAGFIVAFPYIIYQFWKFISPGMKTNERKNSRGFIITSSLLFFTGVLFGYYIILPLSINFFGPYSVSSIIENKIDIDSYVAILRASVLASGLIFQLPIIIFFLTKVGLVTPEFLKKYRKYALVIVLIFAAIITPPDVASQVVVAIPVLILYEVSIHISRIVIKKQNKRAKKNVRTS